MIENQVLTILFLGIAAQGIFLSFLTFLQVKTHGIKKLYLGLFIATFSIILLFWIGFWNNYHLSEETFKFAFYPIPFLLGPFLFYYIKIGLTGISKVDLFHLGPFILATIISIFLWYHADNSGNYALNWGKVDFITYTLHTFSFLYYTLLLLRCFNKNKKTSEQILDTSALNRLKAIILLFGLFSITALTNFVLNRVLGLSIFIDVILALVVCIFVYLIGYIGVNEIKISKFGERLEMPKYSRSVLKPELSTYLFKQLNDHLNTNKSYLEYDYKISDLARETSIPSHHISELLNKYYDKSFSELINSYRIEEAKRMLINGDLKTKTSVLGYEVGFNSKTTFYYWFKKITGMSPKNFFNEQKRV